MRSAELRDRLGAAWLGGERRTRGELQRALRPYVEGQLARGVFLKHITRHLLGLFHGERGGRAFRQVLSEGAHRPGADWSLVEAALAVTENRRSEEHTSELQSLMRISYAVFCLKQKTY